jgi:putative colanic acid biosynthesis UDP-glucose lipid carrier transferase
MQETIFSRTVKLIIFLGDIVFLNALFLILYFSGHLIIHPIDRSWLLFFGLSNVSWLLVLFYSNPYTVFRTVKTGQAISEITFAIFQHFLITSTVLYLFHINQVHEWSVASVYLVFLFVVSGWRLLFIFFLRAYRKRGKNLQYVAVLGYGLLSIQLQRFFQKHPEFGYRISGFFNVEQRSEKKVGGIDDFYSHILENNIDEVYCCVPDVSYPQVREVINWCEDKFIKVKILNEFRAFSMKGVKLEHYDNIPILNVTSLPLDDKRNQLLKRMFDVVFSVVFLITIGWWLFALLAVLIKIDSRGPVFFSQWRAGKNNSHFKCLKFRTMYVNDQADTLQATRSDPRITRLGGFLRKTSLDELPQFLNVLIGDMSIVGPRPHPLTLNERFATRIGKFMARHSVKPGITGLAQSKDYRGETQQLHSMMGRFRLDVFYIENWSFVFDMKIIVDTVIGLWIRNDRAY